MTPATVEEFLTVLQGVVQLQHLGRNHLAQYRGSSAPDSLADQERLQSSELELLETAYSQGEVLIEVASEHLEALIRSAQDHLLPIAAWSCGRSLLEACTLGRWFLDPNAARSERVKRSICFRLEGLRQQVNLARAVGSSEDASRSADRKFVVERQATSLGLSSADVRWPRMTELVGFVFGTEFDYRLLSAVTHAHQWAFQQVAFEVHQLPGDLGEEYFLRKAAKPFALVYLYQRSWLWFESFLHARSRLHDWPVDDFDHTAQALRREFFLYRG